MNTGKKVPKIVLFGVIVCLLGSLFIQACEPQTTTTPATQTTAVKPTGPKSGGTLRINYYLAPTILGWPPEMNKSHDMILGSTFLETLGRFDASGMMIPFLAQSWKEDASAKTITCTLKTGIKFHDGTDFNAEACKWNIDQFIAAKRAELKGITSVSVVDNNTIKINLDQWNNTLLNNLCYYVFMASPAAFAKNGKDWCVKNPVGTGPFKMVSWAPSGKVTMAKNPDYWQKGKPYLDGIEWIPITDAMTALVSFKAGENDLIGELTGKASDDLRKDGKYNFNDLKTGMGSSLMGIMGDSIHPNSPFGNVKVRQAVAYAIDAKTIISSVLYGNSIPTNQYATTALWSFNPNVKGYPYNPEKAKQLLAEAGYTSGFKTKFNFPSNSDLNYAQAIQSYLSKVGINAELDVMDFAGRYNQLCTTGWDGLLQSQTRMDPLVGSVLPRYFGKGGALFAPGLIHPEDLEKLLSDVVKTTNFDDTKKISWELQRLIIDEYCIFTPVHLPIFSCAKYPYVKDDGMFTTHRTLWTPENAWLDK